jgi:hypothetical protein
MTVLPTCVEGLPTPNAISIQRFMFKFAKFSNFYGFYKNNTKWVEDQHKFIDMA